MKQETLTLVLVNLAAIMERADESLLPGVYKEVGAALHTDPTGLGSLTLFRSIVQSSCYPLAAYLASRHNRARVIALGKCTYFQSLNAMNVNSLLGWKIQKYEVIIEHTYIQVAVSRGLNGIGLAIVIPAIQSLVADSTDETNRGMAFGWLQLTGNLGSIIGGLCSVLLASTSFMGIPGWRVAFLLVGIVSAVVGILVALLAIDPRFSASDNRSRDQNCESFISELKDLIREAKLVMKIPTFQILVAQGVSGSFPWSALSFTAMWLELIGFSHEKTAFLMTLFVIACSLGGLFGGRMGDILAKYFPNSGRIVLSQVSSGSAVPLAAVLLLVLPDDPSTAFMHDTVKVETDRENAASLAKALYTAIGIPMALCCSIYSFLYYTYPRDRERARMSALIESELQQLETDRSPSTEEYSQLQVSGSTGMNGKERSKIDLENGKDESIDLDDNDEKALLAHQLTFSNIRD
ncbi:hypothetical protein GH714_018679 [Hevea brasiliensis]|uniref:Major facilitator superfamily (MFS) profile domain-containing protein n=1 Tax=Hevea brasiliensis TaxID=3981 RepID=A0A6A6K9B7_HEVBR|nr:hypothetical protein GH714_018679 [Hevea brasiliensis]